MSVNLLFAKLGHSLEEIRVRALQNILSKLDHGLLCDSDLVQEKHLHIRLLEWFNFPSCLLQDKVLTLILQLSKHSTAAQIYVDIGAIEFLSQLRPNVEPSLRGLVDSILDSLFHLPTGPAAGNDETSHQHACVYLHHSHSAPGSGMEPAAVGSSGNVLRDLSHNYIHPASQQDTQPGIAVHREVTASNAAVTATSTGGGGGRGYFASDGQQTRMHNTQHLTVAAKCLKFATFPWVALTPTDRHVLSSTDESVRSRDVSMVLSVCEFLTDVVFQDFPAEVFLQRPSIVKNLLLLMNEASTPAVLMSAIQTLTDLVGALSSRIRFHQDPCFYMARQVSPCSSETSTLTTASQSFSSSVDAAAAVGLMGQARHRGDGQDVDNTTSTSTDSQSYAQSAAAANTTDMIEQTDIDDIFSLQFVQWTVPQLCFRVLENVTRCMQGPVDEQLAIMCFSLVHQVAALLADSIHPVALWDDTSIAAHELRESFHEVLESLSTAIYSHHHSNLSASLTPDIEMERHRVMFIGLAVFTIRLLRTIVPTSMISVGVSHEFASVLVTLSMDHPLSLEYPDLVSHSLHYARALDNEACVVHHDLQLGIQSINAACLFLGQFRLLNEETYPTLLQLAEDSLPSLQYHVCLDIVDAYVTLTSYVCKKSSVTVKSLEQSHDIVLAALAHNVDAVRQRAYHAMYAIVKEALGIDLVVEPTTSSTLAAMFVVDAKILYQLCAFGMADMAEISDVAEKTLLHLLQSQLLMPAARWQQLMDACAAVHAVLQSCIQLSTSLGRCIVGLLETDPRVDTGTLSLLDRLRGAIRLLFHSDNKVRELGAERSLKLLTLEESSSRKLPPVNDIDIHRLHDVFVINSVSPRTLSADHAHSVLQVSDMKKVYDIFTSESVELSVRRSAADQLAAMITDSSLQSVFISEQYGGLTNLLDTLKSAVKIPDESIVQRNAAVILLPPVVRILLRLIEHDSSLRHRIARQLDVYFALFRCGLLYQKDDEVRRDLSELLALLVFDEMTALREWTSETGILQPELASFSLPECISHRYRLPFVTATHHKRSPWAGKPESDKSLQSGLPAEALRIAWNIAWHNGIEEAISSNNSSADQYSDKMSLTHVEQIIMSVTHLPYAVRQCIYAINNATSHNAVSRALSRLSWYLVVNAPAADINVVKLLSSVTWQPAITRFLTVAPSTGADEQLVLDIVKFLVVVMATHCQAGTPPSDSAVVSDIFSWIGEMLLSNSGALLQLLTKTDLSADSVDGQSTTAQAQHRQAARHLLQFVRVYASHHQYQLSDIRPVKPSSYASISSSNTGFPAAAALSLLPRRCVDGDLLRCIFTKINRVDSVQSYNLPSLELSLLALLHITARQGWSLTCSSADCLTLCLEMLQTLLEVVSAFHAGRGGLLMSYMGRGITRCASICLRHLAHEMAANLRSQEWPRNWLFAKPATVDSVGESGLHWLFPLWTYRDIEVRVAGVSIAAALTATEAGRITMATQCHNVPGGIWGAAFGFLLDRSECGAVRQQAALLLVNLTSQPLPCDGDVLSTTVLWTGPVVRNEEPQVSLVGLPALLVLLQHLDFFNKMSVLISSLYAHSTVQPNQSVAQVNVAPLSATNISSQNTMTTTVSVTPRVNTGILVDLRESASSQLIPIDSMTNQSRIWTLQTSSSLLGQDHDIDFDKESVRRRHITGEGHNGDFGVASAVDIPLPTGTIQSMSSTAGDSDIIAGPAANVDISESSVSQSPTSSDSVVTPSLVSSVACLMSNLVALSPLEVTTALHNRGVLQALMQTVDECLLCISQSQSTDVLYTDVVTMYRHVMSLLSAVAISNGECRRVILDNQTTISGVISLLAVSRQDSIDAWSACNALWKSVFTLLSSMLQSAGHYAYIGLSSVIVSHWKLVSVRVLYIIQDRSYSESDLLITALNFVALLCTEETKFKAKVQGRTDLEFPFISECLDSADSEERADDVITAGPSASLLCQALVKCLDTVLLKAQDQQQFFVMKATVINALKSLLAISSAAKTTALQVGLLESLCEHVRHLHNTLSMDALHLSKLPPAASKKKTNPALTELIMVFDLLRNFLFNSHEVKSCASQSSLANLIHSVWCWSLTNVSLMTATLALLSAYVAQCPSACSSLACTTSTGLLPMTTTPSSVATAKHSNNNSLCHCIVRLIQKEMTSQQHPMTSSLAAETSVVRAAFSLAATLTLSPECRGIMWKSNFLHGFSTLSPQKSKKSKTATGQLDGLWLALFVNLSFSVEGQSMILKIDDALALLIDYASIGHETHQLPALLTLRNLCFHAANKPKLLANEKLLPLLLQHVDSGPGSKTQTIACSALLALVYNNHKAKGLLKTGAVMQRLRDAYNACSSVKNFSDSGESDVNLVQLIRDLMTLLLSH